MLKEFLTRAASRLLGVDLQALRNEIARDTTIVPSIDISRRMTYGFRNAEELSSRELRDVYRGLVADLTSFRAGQFADALLSYVEIQRTAGDDRWEGVETSHPWRELLRRPNDYMDPLSFWEWAFSARDLQGAASCFVEYDALGIPAKLHPIFSEYGRVLPKLDEMGRIAYYVYQLAGSESPYRIEPENVFRLRRPHPLHQAWDASLIQLAAYEIDIDTASNINARDTAVRAERPPILLETDRDVSGEVLDEISVDFWNRYVGATQGVPIASSGLKAKNVQLTDQQFKILERHRFTRSQIHRTWGIPEGMWSDKANRANAEAHLLAFAIYTTRPNLRACSYQVEHQFERLFRADPNALRVWVDEDALIPALDPETQAKIDRLYVDGGIWLRNEVRARDGKDEIDGGEIATVSIGTKPLSQVGTESFL